MLVAGHAAHLSRVLPVQVKAIKVVSAEVADGGLYEDRSALWPRDHADESGDKEHQLLCHLSFLFDYVHALWFNVVMKYIFVL